MGESESFDRETLADDRVAVAGTLRAGRAPCQNHLEGDDAPEPDLPGLVDDAHAAAGDLFQQLVIAE